MGIISKLFGKGRKPQSQNEENKEDVRGGDIVGRGSSTRIVDAARAGDFETVLSLCKDGHAVDERDEFGGTALMYAVGARDEKTVRELLQHGADVNIIDDQGRTALDYAMVFSCPDSIVKLLKEHGARTSDLVEVRKLEPRDVIKYARSSSPDLAVLASMLRSLDARQQLELTMNADVADIETFERALKQR